MASSLSSPYKAAPSQNGKAATTPANASNSSKTIDKKPANMHHLRRSTPDSEALASSDDDHDQNIMSQSAHSLYSAQSTTMPKPPRRGSWLSEVHIGQQQRKASIGSASNIQPGSGPTTPAGESGPSGWGFASGPARSGPWSGAWQREPPGRLLEDEQIDTSMNRYTPDDDALASPSSYHHASEDDDGSFPFPVLRQPVRKNLRSQSYSVGQVDSDMSGSAASATANSSVLPTHARSGFPHRPSRPSMLGESAGGRPVLGQLLEDEVDQPRSPISFSGMNFSRASFSKPDQSSPNLSHPGSGLLKQAAVENALARQRIAGSAGHPISSDHFARLGAGQRMPPGMATESALDDSHEEYKFGDPRRNEAKKALWQTSLGFGPVEDGSQSRRHSFADIPPRARTLSSSLLSPRSNEGLASSASGQSDTAIIDDPASYFNGSMLAVRAHRESQGNAAVRDAAHLGSMNPFIVPSVITNPQPDLYVVTFKCARAEVYYIPANTGLHVKVGDMVIVEGDRGMDLGTVSHARVSMSEAKQLKDTASDQHFHWLMMFSRTMQSATGAAPSTGLLASTNGDRPSAVGGMGPRVPLPSASPPLHPETDIRPKMIRRLAQNHEIQMLREKEGAEAKAKRVCQSKVSDHGLNMEILDAEFQFDWKKLTYFYYAESYVNFNELVTDLFKVYKTRIWMSAINPASFASPSGMPGAGPPNVTASFSPVGSRETGMRHSTSREPVVHGEETAHRFTTYPLYNQLPTASALPFGTQWAPAPAAPLQPYPPINWLGNYVPSNPTGSLTQFLGYRPPPNIGGQSGEAGPKMNPEDIHSQFAHLSLDSQQHPAS